MLSLGGAFLAIQAQLARQADEATLETKRDIVASHHLVERAVARSDRDLFVTFLPDDDRAWSQAQQELFDNGLVFRRDRMGLAAHAGGSTVVSVTLASESGRAGVVLDQAYSTLVIGGTAQTVVLRLTVHYRFDGARWTLAAPAPGDWGETITETGALLTLTYPERDRDIGARLFRDLDAVAVRSCAEMRDLGCLSDRRLLVKLVSRPNSLLDLDPSGRMPIVRRQGTREFSLPAPSLIGIPLDDASYQALYRLYGMHVVRGIVNNPRLLDSTGTASAFYQAAFDELLIRNKLLMWPPTSSGASSSPSSVALPDEKVALYCIDHLNQGGTLYVYDPTTHTSAAELADRIIVTMAALPSHDAILLHEQSNLDSETPSRLAIWRSGPERVVFAAPEGGASASFAGRSDPAERKLVVNLKIGPEVFTPALIDLDRCGPSGCRWTTLTGYPTWSPDGSRTLIESINSSRLSLGDSEGRPTEVIGSGIGPFWLDNQSYGYTQRDRFEVALASVGGKPGRTIAVDAAPVLGHNNDRPMGQVFAQVFATGAGHVLQQFSVDAGEGSATTYTLLTDVRSQTLSTLALDRFIQAASFSPDGRWLAIGSWDATSMQLMIDLLSLQGTQRRSYAYPRARPATPGTSPSIDWSGDGRWLIVLDDGILRLIQPDKDYQRTFVPNSPGCVYAAWIDR